MATLRPRQRRETEKMPPNGYAESPSAQTNGNPSPNNYAEAPVSVERRRKCRQIATPQASTSAGREREARHTATSHTPKGQTQGSNSKASRQTQRAAPAITFAGAAASAFSFSFPAAMPPCMRQEPITSLTTAPASLPAFPRRRSNPAIFNYFEGVALAPHGLGASLRSDESSTSQQLRPSVTVYTISNMRHDVKTFRTQVISML